LPHSFLINKKGIVVKQFVGYHRDSLIEKEIKKMLH
jgi:glutathione peroxidase-family protein